MTAWLLLENHCCRPAWAHYDFETQYCFWSRNDHHDDIYICIFPDMNQTDPYFSARLRQGSNMVGWGKQLNFRTYSSGHYLYIQALKTRPKVNKGPIPKISANSQ